MKYRDLGRLALFAAAFLPFVLLIALGLFCDAALARDRSMMRYCVLDNTQPSRVLVRTCIALGRCQTSSVNTARRSVDGAQMIIKWAHRPETPEVLPAALLSACRVLTHAEAVALVRTPAWVAP